MSPLNAPAVPSGTGNIYYTFDAHVQMSDVTNYQYLFTIGSIEGDCSKDSNVIINQTKINEVLSPQTVYFNTVGSCVEQFSFGSRSNPCYSVRPSIDTKFSFTINRNKLAALSGVALKTWQALHLSVRDANNYSAGCASQPLFIAIKPTEEIRISGLKDMVLTKRSSTGYEQDESFCVFVTDGGHYKLQASGGSASTSPFLLHNQTASISYTPQIDNHGSYTALSPGGWVTNFQGSQSLNCNNSTNAKVRVSIKESDAKRQPAGVYSGTLVLTVAPE
ncbi:hypothetical protein [Endozoicomonas ascidiicola]|uniref:hypothetical protein n=1 Tax=Endozoicomonas ascidiicola TaxID=1698521 RepID=UPI000837481F|nr:hypothetical protein [Endozoicomonas ascidiicola]